MSEKIGKGGFTRREFLIGMGTAAAVPYVGTHKDALNKKSDKIIRMGIVGGRFGASFQWHEHPNCTVNAVCDIRDDRRKRLMQVYGCSTAYRNFKDIINDKNIDAVGVFTPAPLHVYMSVEAMKAGKHVISAVPAGINEEECAELLETVKKTGMIYMMAETSYYRREIISCRKWAQEKKFGEIIYSESEYHHDGLTSLWFDEIGRPTWRYGYPPMLYPTHCTGMIVPVTGERLITVTSTGWGDDYIGLRTNLYRNPFWSQSAMFKTSKGRQARVAIFWNVASGGTERGQFYGTEMSYYMPRPDGTPGITAVREKETAVKNQYEEGKIRMEPYEQPNHYELLPKPLRHNSGHGGSHTFLTHEFVSAVQEKRRPEIDVYEALAYTVPGFYAHKSALEEGKLYKIPDYGKAD
ncbi:Gfo/Idh/MocA family protein [candidate division KSB1 bacterium]